MTRWFDNDRFWQDFLPLMFNPDRLKATPHEVDLLIDHLGIAPGARLLDLGCGIGRHSLEFARRGFNVTGVDRTAFYLDKARAQADAEGLAVEFVQHEMVGFVRPDTFDAAISMFTTFGYYEDPADNQRTAQNVYDSLKAGGPFLIDVSGKETLAAVFRPRDWYHLGDMIVLEERELLGAWDRIHTRWTLLQGSERREGGFILHLYSAAELRALLTACGFRKVDFFGTLESGPYDQTARRLIALAWK
jgi:SAM-dependent methyltransferase